MQSKSYFFRILIKLELIDKFSKNVQMSEVHENPSSGSQVFPCGQTDMRKVIVAFRNRANAPKNCTL